MPKLRHKIDPRQDLEAGLELDALVAEKVMGAKCHCDRNTMTCPIHGWAHWAKPYSTDIGAAWEVVEKLKDNYGILAMHYGPDAPLQWLCELSPVGSSITIDGEAPTASLAICRAALKAVNAKTET